MAFLSLTVTLLLLSGSLATVSHHPEVAHRIAQRSGRISPVTHFIPPERYSRPAPTASPSEAPPPAPTEAEVPPSTAAPTEPPRYNSEPPQYEPEVYRPAATKYSEHRPSYQRPGYHHQRPQYHHGRPSSYGYNRQPAYGYEHRPSYGYRPQYQPKPHYDEPKKPQEDYSKDPACSANGTLTRCLEDADYPEYEVKAAIAHHKYKFLELYADVADLATENSVDRLKTLEEETYLCPSTTTYVKPLRAKNTSDKWRVIINDVKVDYDIFTQTTRIEECETSGDSCPLVPPCYETKCIQKDIVHRFLVYDPYDHYFPFAIETFQFPATCACYVGAYTFDH